MAKHVICQNPKKVQLIAKPGKVVRHVPPLIVHLCKSSGTFMQGESLTDPPEFQYQYEKQSAVNQN